MSSKGKHISVCVCTFKRTQILPRLLRELEQQVTNQQFAFSIVVADNDHNQSGRQCVKEFSTNSRVETTYCVEPRQNIALARNKALEHARGDFVAFIDDDELPVRDWLLQLLKACEECRADGALGPVRPHFEEQPPGWIIRGGFWERPEYKTGRVMKWSEGRTGNLLVGKQVLDGLRPAFDPNFGSGGEDKDFLMRATDRGAVFIWCNEAVVYETIPPARWTRSYMLRRALLRGKNVLKHPTERWKLLATSAAAVPIYLLALPATLLAGQHVFMKCCVKLFDHAGRLLALLGINPVSERDM